MNTLKRFCLPLASVAVFLGFFAVLAATPHWPLRFDPTGYTAFMRELLEEDLYPDNRTIFYYGHPIHLGLLLIFARLIRTFDHGADIVNMLRSFNMLCTAGAGTLVFLGTFLYTRKLLPVLTATAFSVLSFAPFYLTIVGEKKPLAYFFLSSVFAAAAAGRRFNLWEKYPSRFPIFVGLLLGLLSVSHITQNLSVLAVLFYILLAERSGRQALALLRASGTAALIALPVWSFSLWSAGVRNIDSFFGLYKEQKAYVTDLDLSVLLSLVEHSGEMLRGSLYSLLGVTVPDLVHNTIPAQLWFFYSLLAVLLIVLAARSFSDYMGRLALAVAVPQLGWAAFFDSLNNESWIYLGIPLSWFICCASFRNGKIAALIAAFLVTAVAAYNLRFVFSYRDGWPAFNSMKAASEYRSSGGRLIVGSYYDYYLARFAGKFAAREITVLLKDRDMKEKVPCGSALLFLSDPGRADGLASGGLSVQKLAQDPYAIVYLATRRCETS